MAHLATTIAGLQFPHPIMPGAGPNVADGTLLQAAVLGGASALVTHTVSALPAPELSPYREVRGGMLNNQLWSAHTVERWVSRDYREARIAANAAGIPLIISVGYTPSEITTLAPLIAPFADAVELSLHYARVGGGLMADPVTAAYQATHQPSDTLVTQPDLLVATIRAAKAALKVPIFVKLPPLGSEIAAVAQACEAAGADAIVAVNAFGPCLALDLETRSPLLSGDGYGWLSGPALKPLALRCIFDLARAVAIPVIGVGGISRPEDVVEMLMAGASAVQVCTAALQRGPKIYGSLATGLNTWLDDHGYGDVQEVIGLGVRRWRSLIPHTTSLPVIYAEAECIGCKLCVKSCHYDALAMVGKVAALEPERCFGCGLCATRCPTNALVMPQMTVTGAS